MAQWGKLQPAVVAPPNKHQFKTQLAPLLDQLPATVPGKTVKACPSHWALASTERDLEEASGSWVWFGSATATVATYGVKQ